MLNLILGPSGAGKTSLIDELVRERGWVAIESIVTRPAREDDKYKRSISPQAYGILKAENKLWSNVEQLGHSYGISRDDIQLAAEDLSRQYVIDFNYLERKKVFGGVAHLSFALLPESPAELERRLIAAGRVSRVQQALIDYKGLQDNLLSNEEVFLVVNAKDRMNEAVNRIQELAMLSVRG